MRYCKEYAFLLTDRRQTNSFRRTADINQYKRALKAAVAKLLKPSSSARHRNVTRTFLILTAIYSFPGSSIHIFPFRDYRRMNYPFPGIYNLCSISAIIVIIRSLSLQPLPKLSMLSLPTKNLLEIYYYL